MVKPFDLVVSGRFGELRRPSADSYVGESALGGWIEDREQVRCATEFDQA
jgi:hypothetical protein